VSESAYTRVNWRGVVVNARTRDALRWAERKWQQQHRGLSIRPSQGSYKGSGGGNRVRASGGTHDGGGVVDISVSGLSETQRVHLVHALKDAGAAAWFRPPNWDGRGGGPHVHVIFVADREMDPSAARQVQSYDSGRNGLNNNARDDTYRAKPAVRFSYQQGKPVPR
jgi:hypothetical protein